MSERPGMLRWEFPLPRTHTGVLLGNGRTGLMVWGADSTLRITIGRADLWDHRGGMTWSPRQNYRDIRSALERGDEAAIKAIFRSDTAMVPGAPDRPTVLPLGRFELRLASGWELKNAVLDLSTGIVRVNYVDGTTDGPSGAACTGIEKSFEIGIHPSRDIAWIENAADIETIQAVTSWDLMGSRLPDLSFAEPERFAAGGESALPITGWHWALPQDPGVAVGAVRTDELMQSAVPAARDIVIGVVRTPRGADVRSARHELESAFAPISGDEVRGTAGVVSVFRLAEETSSWWRSYWRRVPRISLPNRDIEEIYYYGLYCFAGLTNPAGVAATLQGPWIEEYGFPPWSSDYHFNINVQMCYSPAFRAGLFDHLKPLFDLVCAWKPLLRSIARDFIRVDDGYMLPHAVDDRGTCMGNFWTGAIDHACTAWVAGMMADYVSYSGDFEFLRDHAYDFLKGAFSVYHAMLEDDGTRLRLPVSVSPEYRGAAMNAWGANASFQLAAIHRLCEQLQWASDLLGVKPDPRWADVRSRLPLAAVGESGRIELWEGTELEESHRHHSHLAAIAPFDTIDIHAPEWNEIVAASIRHWIRRGMGMWSGWCYSWASALHSRIGNGDASELLLEIWRRVFTNEGRGSNHDPYFNGITLMGVVGDATAEPVNERMQMDAVCGGVAAVQEMLLHEARGVLNVFTGANSRWPQASFERMYASGGLLVSAWYERPTVVRIEIEATRAATVRIRLPWSAGAVVVRNGHADEAAAPPVATLELAENERVVIEPITSQRRKGFVVR